MISGNLLRGNVTASGYVNISRYSFYSVNNAEDGAPTLYNATFSYGPISGGTIGAVWTAPNSSYDDKAMSVLLRTTNPGASAGGTGAVTAIHGKSAARRNMVSLYNPTGNSANGTGYIFFTGEAA